MRRKGAGLVGTAVCVELHQKRKKTVRYILRQLVECLKLLADRCLKGAKAQGFRPSIMFAAFRGLKPFLSHFKEKGASWYIRCLLGQGKALGRQTPSLTRPINWHDE